MSTRRIVILIAMFMLVSSLPALASDMYHQFKAREVKVTFNGVPSNESGLLTDQGKVLLPLRDIAGTLQAIVKWNEDEQQVNIYKPNVHVLPFQYVKDEIKSFGNVKKGKYDFRLQTQVDSLQTEISSVKFTIIDPHGTQVYESVYNDSFKEEFWLTTKQINLDFQYAGKYTVQVYMKVDEDSEYDLVTERVIRCIDDQK